MSFERTNLGPVRTDVNALWDLATHDISIMCDLLDCAPLTVTARGECYLNAGIEDVVFATFGFPNSVIAHVHASWLNPRKVRQLTVVGSKKMMVWDDLDLKAPIKIYDKRVEMPSLEEGASRIRSWLIRPHALTAACRSKSDLESTPQSRV